VTRQRKSPRQRAEEALGVANRAVIALDKKVDRLAADLAVARRELETATRRRDYLAQHPDLPQHPTTTTLEEPTA
jgi:hypothetical protein